MGCDVLKHDVAVRKILPSLPSRSLAMLESDRDQVSIDRYSLVLWRRMKLAQSEGCYVTLPSERTDIFTTSTSVL